MQSLIVIVSLVLVLIGDIICDIVYDSFVTVGIIFSIEAGGLQEIGSYVK